MQLVQVGRVVTGTIVAVRALEPGVVRPRFFLTQRADLAVSTLALVEDDLGPVEHHVQVLTIFEQLLEVVVA